ncbi:MAG TPA: hypothetical protein ENF89_01725 [Candidatus Bathyarchaeota archaeon]|nr:hypothetical protein [Candidatus Bathyarchaeota archaeon]
MEWRSQLEDLMPAGELRIPPTPGFGPYKPFLSQGLAHPAKANTRLLEWLVLTFTKPGDIILDPMAGSGSTGVVAALHGRNAILVDIERRFYRWMLEAAVKVNRHRTLSRKGWIWPLLGDARQLSRLLEEADIPFLKGRADLILTSPPYADAKRGGRADKRRMAERWDRAFRRCGGDWNSWGDTWKTPGRMRSLEALGSGYSENSENIGNLPFGEVDIILTSPPYSESLSKRRKGYTVLPQLAETRQMGEDTKDENIANLPHGSIDTIITSPPYGDSISESRAQESPLAGSDESRYGRWRKGTARKHSYTQHFEPCSTRNQRRPDNIGNLPLGSIDIVITSPPYLKSAEMGAGINRQRPGDVKIGCYTIGRTVQNPETIDNLKAYGKVDVVITSPPYSEGIGHKAGPRASDTYKDRLELQRR